MLDVAQKHGFHFDTVQMPVNIMDAHFRSFSQLVVPEALRQKVAVVSMKCFGDAIILKSGAVEPIDCLRYSLNVPISVLITGINSKMLLDQAFAAVKSFQPMDEAAVASSNFENGKGRDAWQVRTLQDDLALRHHRAPS